MYNYVYKEISGNYRKFPENDQKLPEICGNCRELPEFTGIYRNLSKLKFTGNY